MLKKNWEDLSKMTCTLDFLGACSYPITRGSWVGGISHITIVSRDDFPETAGNAVLTKKNGLVNMDHSILSNLY